MPMDLNPYYFRGHLKIGFGQYEAALRDFDKVASDTTSDTDILLARSEAYRMLRKYDSSIAVCNKLLELGYEPSVVLTQRGINYLGKSMKSEACHDFSEAKKFAGANLSYIDSLLLKCE